MWEEDGAPSAKRQRQSVSAISEDLVAADKFHVPHQQTTLSEQEISAGLFRLREQATQGQLLKGAIKQAAASAASVVTTAAIVTSPSVTLAVSVPAETVFPTPSAAHVPSACAPATAASIVQQLIQEWIHKCGNTSYENQLPTIEENVHAIRNIILSSSVGHSWFAMLLENMQNYFVSQYYWAQMSPANASKELHWTNLQARLTRICFILCVVLSNSNYLLAYQLIKRVPLSSSVTVPTRSQFMPNTLQLLQIQRLSRGPSAQDISDQYIMDMVSNAKNDIISFAETLNTTALRHVYAATGATADSTTHPGLNAFHVIVTKSQSPYPQNMSDCQSNQSATPAHDYLRGHFRIHILVESEFTNRFKKHRCVLSSSIEVKSNIFRFQMLMRVENVEQQHSALASTNNAGCRRLGYVVLHFEINLTAY
jgi:hypothetical protein